ncbi:DNA replication licensing factor MCM2, partial [Tanacetum coccineum]
NRYAVSSLMDTAYRIYDSSKTFWENVVLKDRTVSAFDVLCVVKVDDVEKIMKKVCAMVDLDTDSDAESTTSDWKRKYYPDMISHDMLKNYITYARLNVFPSFTISSRYDTQSRENVPVPEKQLHSLERLAEAHARMHLRQEVVREDVLAALHVLSVSLISLQNLGAQESVRQSLKSLNDYLLFANALQ